MQPQPLKVEKRRELGKGPARRLRREGKLPGTLYGKRVGNLPIAVPYRDLERLLQREGESVLLKVVLQEGDRIQEYPAIIKEVQRDPIKEVLLHVDLHQIALDEEIRAEVPLLLVGEPKGVKRGGILQHSLRVVEVECLPTHLPEHISVEVSELDIGDSLKVEDIVPPPGVKILTEGDSLIATVVAPALEAEEEAETAPEAESGPSQ